MLLVAMAKERRAEKAPPKRAGLQITGLKQLMASGLPPDVAAYDARLQELLGSA
jgi:hypothetical protein